MAEYLIQDTTLTGIADAVRTKTGSTDAITAESIADAIGKIKTPADNSIPSIGAKTIIPKAYAQTAVPVGCYTRGDVVVVGSATFVAQNIKTGVKIFGVTGSYYAPDDALFLKETLEQTHLERTSLAMTVAMTYADGKFVAVSYGSDKAAYSTDGIAWTETTLPVIDDWGRIVYGNGVFVVASDNSNNIVYSTDGITWSATTHPYEGGIYDLLYANSKFVLVGYSDSGTIACSTDGIAWNTVDLPDNGSGYWNKVVYDGDIFVVTGYGSTVAYSADCESWSTATLPSDTDWNLLTYGDGTLVAMSYNSDTAAYSSDGINWTAVTLPVSGYWHNLVYGNGVFLTICCMDGAMICSADGITWSVVTLPDVDYSDSPIVYGDGTFVIVPTESDKAAYSTDGITWTEATLPVSGDWYGLTYGDGKFVAAALGTETNDSVSVSAYSADGITWNAQIIAAILDVSDADVTDTVRAAIERDWVGELTFSGDYADNEAYITQAGCSLAVDPIRGMAFLVLQNGTSTTYENIYFQDDYMTLPDGVTFLPTQKYGGPTAGSQSVYFAAAFTGVTGKINVDVELRVKVDSSYDYATPQITMTYA